MTSCHWYCASSFFFRFSFFLHLVLFLHLVKVCIVVLIVFRYLFFCTNGDNSNNNNERISKKHCWKERSL